MTQTFTLTSDSNQIQSVAKEILNLVDVGDWIFLDGDMGAGKTTLAKEISLLLGTKDFLTSPTFSILNSVKTQTNFKNIQQIIHLDLYRLKSSKELCFIGLEEEFNSKKCIGIFEWPDLIDDEGWEYFFNLTNCPRPKKIINIKIEGVENTRKYIINRN